MQKQFLVRLASLWSITFFATSEIRKETANQFAGTMKALVKENNQNALITGLTRCHTKEARSFGEKIEAEQVRLPHWLKSNGVA